MAESNGSKRALPPPPLLPNPSSPFPLHQKRNTKQDVPFSERHPSLGRPVYTRLLDVLLSKCELPAGLVTWDSFEGDGDDIDEDALTELREGAQVNQPSMQCTTVA